MKLKKCLDFHQDTPLPSNNRKTFYVTAIKDGIPLYSSLVKKDKWEEVCKAKKGKYKIFDEIAANALSSVKNLKYKVTSVKYECHINYLLEHTKIPCLDGELILKYSSGQVYVECDSCGEVRGLSVGFSDPVYIMSYIKSNKGKCGCKRERAEHQNRLFSGFFKDLAKMIRMSKGQLEEYAVKLSEDY